MIAMVFGATGQAGSYMVEFLRKKGYLVSTPSLSLDKTCGLESSLSYILTTVRPDEIYNFAGKLNVSASWEQPKEFLDVNGTAVVCMLDAIAKSVPAAKFFQASSASVFDLAYIPQSERTPRKPDNPYALSKLVADGAVRFYREFKGVKAVRGIFFNMESSRRKEDYFTRKVAMEAVRIKTEIETGGNFVPAKFGDLSPKRDWGLAEEYVEAAWLMLQAKELDDYVIGTGETHSCYEFVVEVFNRVLNGPQFKISPEQCFTYSKYDKETKDIQQADVRKIKHQLNWEAKSKFKDVVRELVMVELMKGALAAK